MNGQHLYNLTVTWTGNNGQGTKDWCIINRKSVTCDQSLTKHKTLENQ